MPFHMRCKIRWRHKIPITDWAFIIKDSYSTTIVTGQLNLTCEMLETELRWLIKVFVGGRVQVRVRELKFYMHKNAQGILNLWVVYYWSIKVYILNRVYWVPPSEPDSERIASRLNSVGDPKLKRNLFTPHTMPNAKNCDARSFFPTTDWSLVINYDHRYRKKTRALTNRSLHCTWFIVDFSFFAAGSSSSMVFPKISTSSS